MNWAPWHHRLALKVFASRSPLTNPESVQTEGEHDARSLFVVASLLVVLVCFGGSFLTWRGETCQTLDASGYTKWYLCKIRVYYPENAGEFPEDINPPQELLDVAVAKYECGVCSCTEEWAIHKDGQWLSPLEGGVEEFCTFLIETNAACNGCLVEWVGGCC